MASGSIEQEVSNAFLQFRASSKTSVLAELRSSKIEKGDLDLLFDPTDFNSTLRLKEDVDSARIGGRHAFSGHSILLASFIYQEAYLSARTTVPVSFSGDADYDSFSADLQHIYRREKWHVITGVNHIGLESNETIKLSAMVPFPPFVIDTTTTLRDDTDTLNAYVYSTWMGLEDVSITLGGSYDAVKATDRDDDWFNPKLGLMWDIGPTTRLRAAAFQTVQSPFISKQNIQPRLEPTQVAGFNQFFYGTDGEVAEHYGIAIDH